MTDSHSLARRASRREPRRAPAGAGAASKPERPAPPDPDTLDERQAARRQRIVDATLQLMLERDYDSLQMTDITAASGAALGTVYRYFSSKEHLVAEGLLAWSGGFDGSTTMPPARSIDRIKLAYRRAIRAFERHPRLYDHLLALSASADPYATKVFDEFARRQDLAFAGYLPRVPSPRREQIVLVMDAVLAANLRDWTVGRQTISAVYRSIDAAAELLLG